MVSLAAPWLAVEGMWMNFSASCGWTISAAGDDHFAGLLGTLHRVEDDVLLQHAVASKGGLAGFKDVNAPQLQLAQEVFAEWAEVRAVAKAARRNADELPAGNEQALNEGDEAGVEVAGFDANETQRVSLGRVSADFAIRWIGDGHIECGRMCAEQITRETCRHFLDEVGGVNVEPEANARLVAATLALVHGRGKRV
jgi:hypothetical protein